MCGVDAGEAIADAVARAGERIKRCWKLELNPGVYGPTRDADVDRVGPGGDQSYVFVATDLAARQERVEVGRGEAASVGRPVADAKVGPAQRVTDALLF